MSRQLDTVRRVRQIERDDRQRALAEALAALDLLDDRLRKLRHEADAWQRMRRQRGKGPIDVDFLASANRYRWLLAAQQQHFQSERDRLEAEITRRRTALIDAERQLQSIEKLIDKRRAEARRAQARLEQRQLDEAAGAAWCRREVNS